MFKILSIIVWKTLFLDEQSLEPNNSTIVPSKNYTQIFTYTKYYIRFRVYIIFQEKLQNSFRQATTKISATIGLGLPRTDNNEPTPIIGDDMTTINAENMMTTIDTDAVTDNDDDWFSFFHFTDVRWLSTNYIIIRDAGFEVAMLYIYNR